MTEFRRREEELMDMVTSTGEQAEGLNTEVRARQCLDDSVYRSTIYPIQSA